MFGIFKKKHQVDEYVEHKKPDFDDRVAKAILSDIKKEFGLDYEKQAYITFRKLERFALKHDIYDFNQLAAKITSSRELKEALINMLTVGETYFYREQGHFEILSDYLHNHKVSKILCAPSSTGEEVYSILLYILQKQKRIDFDILGIDINSDALKQAQSACYSKRSVSKLPQALLNEYFKLEKEHYCLSETVKKYARFEYQNVFDESFERLGKFDVIFCRNMLIYFNDEEKKFLLERFRARLNPKGILFLGHADISFMPDGYTKEHSRHGSFYTIK